MKQRLQSIDRLKGLAIILVIIGHLPQTFHSTSLGENLFIQQIYSFHMALFMVLSGIVASIPQSLKGVSLRLASLWSPFLLIGGAYAWFRDITLYTFFTDYLKVGYWYLFILGVLYLGLLPFLLNKGKGKTKVTIDFIIIVSVFLLFWTLNKLFPQVDNAHIYANIFTFKLCYFYWGWFSFGFLLKRYELLHRISQHNSILSSALLLYGVCSILTYSYEMTFLVKALGLFATISLLHFFTNREKQNTWIEKKLSELGQRTLDIYVFHTFFIASIELDCIAPFIRTNPFLSTLLFIGLALLIAYSSIFVGYLIRQSKLLEAIIYGKWLEKCF